MQRKVLAGILLLTALISLIAIIYSWIYQIPVNGVVIFIMLFMIVPGVAGTGIWLKKKWGIILGLLFYVPQIMNIQGTYEFMSPITLGVTMGINQIMIYINILAIAMTVLLVKQLKETKDNVISKVASISEANQWDFTMGASFGRSSCNRG